MSSVKEEIAANLRYFRKRSALSQQQLADLLGVKFNTVSSWENAKNSIDIEILFRMCEIFNCSVNDMYGKFANTQTEQDKKISTIAAHLETKADELDDEKVKEIMDYIDFKFREKFEK